VDGGGGVSVHRCCECSDDGACNCLGDCNDFDKDGSQQLAGCWDCCWSPGDAIRWKASWGGANIQRRETLYPGFGGGGPQCADVTYAGGDIEVEYVVVGCSKECPPVDTTRVKVIFALNTEFGGLEFIKGVGWVKQTAQYRYRLQNYLALVCQTVTDGEGNGDFKWYTYTNCDIPPELLKPCVSLCQTDCTDVDYDPCNGQTPDSFCNGGSGIQPPSPDWYNCPRCVDALVSCGGLKAYCCYRWVDSECAFNGNEYGEYFNQQTGQFECGYGCGADATPGRFHPITTCETAVVQTLELAPPAGAERHCEWHEWTVEGIDYHCCRDAQETGGSDLVVPPAITSDCPTDQSYPDDWTGSECDCTVNPQAPANCLPVPCNAITTLVSDGAKEVCL